MTDWAMKPPALQPYGRRWKIFSIWLGVGAPMMNPFSCPQLMRQLPIPHLSRMPLGCLRQPDRNTGRTPTRLSALLQMPLHFSSRSPPLLNTPSHPALPPIWPRGPHAGPDGHCLSGSSMSSKTMMSWLNSRRDAWREQPRTSEQQWLTRSGPTKKQHSRASAYSG